MAVTPFRDLLDARSKSAPGHDPRSRRTLEWFRRTAQSVVTTPQQILGSPEVARVAFPSQALTGALVMFLYDPKLKKTLPYYDKFPAAFVVDSQRDRFLGMNMHYLPPVWRARLMDALHELASDKKYNEATRLELSYKVLKGSSRYRAFGPCLKSYLRSHVQSRTIVVSPYDWDKALFLPLARFEKADQSKVWQDSLRGF